MPEPQERDRTALIIGFPQRRSAWQTIAPSLSDWMCTRTRSWRRTRKDIIDRAWDAQLRLCKRFRKLTQAGKHPTSWSSPLPASFRVSSGISAGGQCRTDPRHDFTSIHEPENESPADGAAPVACTTRVGVGRRTAAPPTRVPRPRQVHGRIPVLRYPTREYQLERPSVVLAAPSAGDSTTQTETATTCYFRFRS